MKRLERVYAHVDVHPLSAAVFDLGTLPLKPHDPAWFEMVKKKKPTWQERASYYEQLFINFPKYEMLCEKFFYDFKKNVGDFIGPDQHITVFISYAHPFDNIDDFESWTKPYIEKLVKNLEKFGIQAIFDDKNSPTGQSTITFMEENIDRCDFILLIGTETLCYKCTHFKEDNKTAYFVQCELVEGIKKFETAKSKNSKSPILPILISGTTELAIPYYPRKATIKEFSENSAVHMSYFECLVQLCRDIYVTKLGGDNKLSMALRSAWDKWKEDITKYWEEFSPFITGLTKAQVINCQPQFPGPLIRYHSDQKVIEALIAAAKDRRLQLPVTNEVNWLVTGLSSLVIRKKSIDNLNNMLKQGNIIAIWGSPGMGKSTLAQGYLKKKFEEKEFDVIWLFQASDKNLFEKDYQIFAKKLGIEFNFEAVPIRWLQLEVNKKLENLNLLLLFEKVSAETYELIKLYFPLNDTKIKRIITTRDELLLKDIEQVYRLHPLDELEALELLRRVTGRPVVGDEYAISICRSLGCIPLYLDHAARSIKKSGVSYELYFRNHKKEDDGIPETCQNVILSSIKDLSEEQRSLLIFCAHLAPEDIPELLLQTFMSHHLKTNNIFDQFQQDYITADAITVLRRQGWLILCDQDKYGIKYSIHETYQRTVSKWWNDSSNEEDKKRIKMLKVWIITINDCFAKLCFSPQEVKEYQAWLSLEAHSRKICEIAEKHFELLVDFVPYIDFLIYRGYAFSPNVYLNFTKAEFHYKKAYDLLKPFQKSNPVKILKLLDHMGYLYRNVGHFSRSKDYYMEASEIWKANDTLPPSIIIRCFHGLIETDRCLGDPEIGKSYLKKVRNLSSRITKAEDPETLFQLGDICIFVGEFDIAKLKLVEALSIWKYGGNKGDAITLNLAKCHNNLGVVCYERGELKEAMRHAKEAMKLYQTVYGEQPYSMRADTLNLMGLIELANNNIKKAKEYFESVLGICKALYSRETKKYDRRRIAKCYSNLATILCREQHIDNKTRQENLNKALELHLQALKIKCEIYGDKHWGIAASMHDIARVYDDLEDYLSAEKYYLDEIALREKLCDSKPHSYLANSYYCLGWLYCKKDLIKKAKHCLTQAINIYINSSGDHAGIIKGIEKELLILNNNLNSFFMKKNNDDELEKTSRNISSPMIMSGL